MSGVADPFPSNEVGYARVELRVGSRVACYSLTNMAVSVSVHVIFSIFYYCLAILYLFIGVQNRKFYKCLLKCLPIIFLMLFVVLLSAAEATTFKEPTRLNRLLLLLALTFSCIGDGCLVFRKVFVAGVASFGVSLVLYISVLEMRDSISYIRLDGVLMGICIFFVGVLISVTIKVMTSRSSKFPSVRKVVMAMILSYFFILSLLLWSGLLLFLRRKDYVGTGAAVGTIMFYISDLLIAAGAFWDLRLLRGRGLVMLTYYTAHLFLVLSISYL